MTLPNMVRKMIRKANAGKLVDPARRRQLRGAAAWAAVAALPFASLGALAASRASKQDVQYQDTPKNGQQCDGCIHYQPENSGQSGVGRCAVVAGQVSAQAYCIAYSAKS